MPHGDEGSGGKELRNVVWGVSSFLAVVGLLGGLYTTQPWPSKEAVTQLERALAREITEREKLDEASAAERRTNTLAIQALQYELRQMRDRHQWAEAEIESLRAYVYPQRLQPTRPKPSRAE